MPKYNNASSHYYRWTNKKLIDELRKYANLESFSVSTIGESATMPATDDAIREKTRLYRQTWMDPLINEIESRFIKKITVPEERDIKQNARRAAIRGDKPETCPYPDGSPLSIQRKRYGLWMDTFNAERAAIKAGKPE